MRVNYPHGPRYLILLTIDGTTQPGFGGAPIIELNGAGAGTVAGLRVSRARSDTSGPAELIVSAFDATTFTKNRERLLEADRR